MMIIKIVNKCKSILYYLFKYPFYFILFKKMGKFSRIMKPLKIEGYENISIGSNVVIGKHSWLAAVALNDKNSVLEIGSGSRIGNFNHIYALSKIVIEKDVLTADKVYISDNQHTYDSIAVPIHKQEIKQLKHVSIGEGTWIGENVCIIGVSIGRNCVIGANSIVNKDIPDFCVAVGSPAKIIKRYCEKNKTWLKTNSLGEFN